MTAMIPVPRLSVHIKRLVSAGHKVGVVRQTETRALKAASDTSNAPFARALSEVYTATTWIDELGTGGAPEQVLAAVVEHGDTIGFAAVDVATTAVTFDNFSDGPMRSGLETRLAHLAPAELLVSAVGPATTRALRAYASSANVRSESVSGCDGAGAVTSLAGFFEGASGDALAYVLTLPTLVQCALAYLVQYLRDFGLTSAFSERSNYRSFHDRTSMMLGARTIRDLELFANTTDQREHGSLCWLLDRCRTPMGKRMLRRWIRRPLVSVAQLQERQRAVSVARDGTQRILQQAVDLLFRLPDLERGLARIVYGRSSPSELVTVLLTLYRVTHEIEPAADASLYGTGSATLDMALAALSVPRDAMHGAVNAIRITEARRNNMAELYSDPGRYPDIAAAKQVLAEDEAAFGAHLAEIREALNRPTLQYSSVSGVDHLVEMRLGDARKAPADWIRVSSTKAVVRFHTPTLVQLTKQRDRHREELSATAKTAFRHFCAQVASNFEAMKNVVDALATIDAIASLGAVAKQPGYSRPTVDAASARIALRGFRHPMSEALMTGTYVPNDIELGENSTPAVLLTGANMGGKSSAVRAVALIVVLAHIGSYVPCTSAEMSCHDSIATRMGAHDDVLGGKSTFFVEAEETAHILRSATQRTLVVLDEFGRGTSTFDGTALAYAVLQSLLERGPEAPRLLFITHYTALGDLATHFPRAVRNMHMATLESATGADDLSVVFLHELRDGLATHSLGTHVAALVGMPRRVVTEALRIADTMRKRDCEASKRRRAARYARMLRHAFLPHCNHALDWVKLEAEALENTM